MSLSADSRKWQLLSFSLGSPFIVVEVDGEAIVSNRSLVRKSFGESFSLKREGYLQKVSIYNHRAVFNLKSREI